MLQMEDLCEANNCSSDVLNKGCWRCLDEDDYGATYSSLDTTSGLCLNNVGAVASAYSGVRYPRGHAIVHTMYETTTITTKRIYW
jgi:hypothetical protein